MREQEIGALERVRLRITCPDGLGIVASVAQFLATEGANIVQSDQYSLDPSGGQFFMRIVFECAHAASRLEDMRHRFDRIAKTYDMNVQCSLVAQKKRIGIFVTKEDHCLLELLWLWQAGDLDADIAVVVSNHDTLRHCVAPMGIPFVHIPINDKEAAERQQLAVLETHGVHTVVLARYMQIVSPTFVAQYPQQMINIHHSFLPAFVGGNPYRQALDRGVKMIGATAHYVTNVLDEGPIIEQDVQRVTHRDDLEALKRIGKHVERTVLARAVQWHLDDRVLVIGNKTVVFR
jgi:formyltetrahydrofolate deformylase